MSDLPVAEVTYSTKMRATRRGHCFTHPEEKPTTFMGLVQAGWVFHCPGGAGHYIVNQPPEGE